MKSISSFSSIDLDGHHTSVCPESVSIDSEEITTCNSTERSSYKVLSKSYEYLLHHTVYTGNKPSIVTRLNRESK